MQEVFSPFETTHDARKEPRAKKTRGPLRKAACKLKFCSTTKFHRNASPNGKSEGMSG